jgi:hypothetical protein
LLPCAISREWSAVLKSRQIWSWHMAHSSEPMYLAPGISGSTTAWRDSELQEITVSDSKPAAAASNRHRPVTVEIKWR